MRTILFAVLAVLSLASASAGAGAQAGDAPAKKFTITGQIRNPGSYAWEEGLIVEKAIARAGGLADRGSTSGITIRRMVDGEMKMVTVKLDSAVLPDDVINIRQRVF